MTERWFQSLKYERLYRHDIATVIDLAEHVAEVIDEYNSIRPHDTLDWRRLPRDPNPQPRPRKTEQES